MSLTEAVNETTFHPELPPSPYKGLVPYTEANTRFFFGRELERERISGNLQASALLYFMAQVGWEKARY